MPGPSQEIIQLLSGFAKVFTVATLLVGQGGSNLHRCPGCCPGRPVAPSELQHIVPQPRPAPNPTEFPVFPAPGGVLLNLNGQSPVL
jgi:hypothetical protein